MGSNPISRTKKQKAPVLGAFLLHFTPIIAIKLTININKMPVSDRELTENCTQIAHELHTATKTAHETAHVMHSCTHFMQKKAAHFAAPIISSKK